MNKKATKDLIQKIIEQEKCDDKVEKGYDERCILEDENEIREELVEALKEEKWGISLTYHTKSKKIELLEARKLFIKKIVKIIDWRLKKTDISRANPNINEELQEIKQELIIENQQLIWAKKNIDKKIESWEDIVTIQDLKDLENMMKNTRQKLNKIREEIEKYRKL